MRGKFIHGLSATIVLTSAFLTGCSDNASDAVNASSELSSNSEAGLSSDQADNSCSSQGFSSSAENLSSSATTSSSNEIEAPSSSTTTSSSNEVEEPSSSATTTSSSETEAQSSANITPSSSSVSSPATSSSTDTSLFEPITRSSSSYSKLRNEPEDERHKIYRLLYPVENGTLDTGYFDQGDCEIQSNGSFACRQKSCIEYVGGYINFHSEGMFPNDGDERHAKYFQGSTDETRLIDINLGDSALTSYIPYADIPEFDIEGIKAQLSTLPAATCTTLVQFVSNYKMSASGLPEGFVLHLDANFALMPLERVTEPYSMVFPKDEIDTVKTNISNSEKRLEHGYTLFDEIQYAKESLFSKSSIEYNTYVSNQGCGIVAQTYNPMPSGAAGRCQGWVIPERARDFSVRLINTSDKTPASFTWKLTYMDQFGRGGTIDITTQLK